jgi:hypothetical protein
MTGDRHFIEINYGKFQVYPRNHHPAMVLFLYLFADCRIKPLNKSIAEDTD